MNTINRARGLLILKGADSGDFKLNTGEPRNEVYECRTYDKTGRLVKTEMPRMDKLVLQDMKMLQNDKTLRKWVNYI